MILLDPDLGPSSDRDPGPSASAARRISARSANSDRIPSARSLTRFLREAQIAIRLRGPVSVLLTTDQAIRKLNRQFRGKNKATDVLSFPAGPGPEKLAGDLAISVETAQRQSAACGHSLAAELKVLILHGLLHLAGYDHEADEGQMARRERVLRARLGLPLGLIERTMSVAPKSGSASSVPSQAKGKTKDAPLLGHPSVLADQQKAVPSTRSRRALAQDAKPKKTARTGRSRQP